MFDLIESEKSVLFIDLPSEAASQLERLLASKYHCDFVETSEDALFKLGEREYTVVLLSAEIVNFDGLELIGRMRSTAPHSPIVLIGDEVSAEATIRVFRAGAFDYVFRPFEFEQVEAAMTRASDQFDSGRLKDRYQVHLENLAAERATEIDKALEQVESSYRITLKALVQALETRDFETHGHSERVVTFSLRLGYELGLEKEALRDLELGALLHDIGKIGVPDAILRKPAPLNHEEWTKMRLHPLHGQKILRNIKFLEGAAKVVGQHHERWDGEGYPHGMRGEEIDIGARIFAVVDAFDAMISDRVYRRGRPYAEALAELEAHAGAQFDPLIVEAFKAVPKEDWEILRERSLMDNKEISSFQSVVAELVYSRNAFEMIH